MATRPATRSCARSARCCSGGVRQVDLAGRYGGEEFALILPETDLPGALKLAERLRVALETTPVELADGKTLQVTASFGVALKDELPPRTSSSRSPTRRSTRPSEPGRTASCRTPRAGATSPGSPSAASRRRPPRRRSGLTPAEGEI